MIKREIKIRPIDNSEMFYKVFVDGKEINGITKLDLHMDCDGIPTLCLTINALNTNVDVTIADVSLVVQKDSKNTLDSAMNLEKAEGKVE